MRRGRITLLSMLGDGAPGFMAALRVLAYDKLVLIGGPHIEQDPNYARIRHLESFARDPVEVVRVDPYNFRECFTTVNGLIREHGRGPDRVVVNVAGGTKLMACAAILAAFQNGVEVYHVEEEVVKLPVILGLTVRDRFSPTEMEVARALRDGDTPTDLLTRLSSRGLDNSSLQRSLRKLQSAGVLKLVLKDGKVSVHWSQETQLLKAVLLA